MDLVPQDLEQYAHRVALILRAGVVAVDGYPLVECAEVVTADDLVAGSISSPAVTSWGFVRAIFGDYSLHSRPASGARKLREVLEITEHRVNVEASTRDRVGLLAPWRGAELRRTPTLPLEFGPTTPLMGPGAESGRAVTG